MVVSEENYNDCTCSNYTKTTVAVIDPTFITRTSIVCNDYDNDLYDYKSIGCEWEEKFYRNELLEEIKSGWHQLKKQFKNIPKNRPDIRLRGVCFSGRGWA